MKIALVGAIDRYNYGDVLFPIVVAEALKLRMPDVDFEFYGYKESDFSRYNAYPTKAMTDLAKDDISGLIVVGGEVLTSPWSLTYLFMQENYFKSTIINFFRPFLFNPHAESIFRKVLKDKRALPWLYKKSDFSQPDVKIIYNAVGGAASLGSVERHKKSLLDNLNEADFISVREHDSKKNLSIIGIKNVKESPDSAFLMSELFPRTKLPQLSTLDFKVFGPYVVFQIGKKYGKNNIEKVVEQLCRFMDNNPTYQVVLLPIGMAALHEDDIPLKKILLLLKKQGYEDRLIFVEENTIFDTMRIIADSSLFVGTSLHGNVTALSYGVPSVGLDPRVTKLKSLLRTYSIEEQAIGVTYDDLCSSMEVSLKLDKHMLKDNADVIIKSVNDNFDQIADVLKKTEN